MRHATKNLPPTSNPMRKSKIKLHILFGMLAIMLSACQNRTICHTYRTIHANGWNRQDSLLFPIPVIHDTATPLHLTVEIRNTSKYPYTNLFLTINGDTMECILANGKGEWTGKGISTLYQNQFPYEKSLQIAHPDTLMLNIRHIMSDSLLQGIQDIGIRLER